jgi:hypothetical protein
MFVNTLTDPPSRVHSQLCENVPEELCTLMEEEEEDLISSFGILEKQQRILKHVLFNFMNLNESHKKI